MKLPMPAPTTAEIIETVDFSQKFTLLMQIVPTPGGKYLHWDELSRRQLLEQRKSGRKFVFTAPMDLAGRLSISSTATPVLPPWSAQG